MSDVDFSELYTISFLSCHRDVNLMKYSIANFHPTNSNHFFPALLQQFFLCCQDCKKNGR